MKRRPYEKYLDRGLRLWIVRTANKNHWRVASWYDLDDLIQDGFLAWAICKERYAERVENKAHFMALFKRVYFNMIIDLANKRSRDVPQIVFSQLKHISQERERFIDEHPDLISDVQIGGEHGEQELIATLSSAPKEVLSLLDFFQSGKARSGALKLRYRIVDGRRETNNQFWNRVLGFTGFDFEGECRALLSCEPNTL